jgi:hypothetical protein
MIEKTHPDIQWTTLRERQAIAEAFSTTFRAKFEAANMVEGHPSLGSFLMIRGDHLLTMTTFPHFNDCRHKLVTFSRTNNNIFVSHRWLDRRHPDPLGRQLRWLQKTIQPDAYYWIDYSCLPQKPHAGADSALLNESLPRLAGLFFESHFLVVRSGSDGYVDRAWCFLELFGANVIARSVSHVFGDDSDANATAKEERKMLEQALTASELPPNLAVTDRDDLIPIGDQFDTLSCFFELNLLMHYLRLGQKVSNGLVFRSEYPYYFFATCDFSQMMLWVFDRARQHGMPLSDLGKNEGGDNFFIKLAAKENFRHNVNPYVLPKKITRDITGESWYIIHKNYGLESVPDSEHHLFYILTSLIR